MKIIVLERSISESGPKFENDCLNFCQNFHANKYRQSQNQHHHYAERDACMSMDITYCGEAESVVPRLRKQTSSSSIGSGAKDAMTEGI